MLAADVIINELMYHPSSGDIGEEYIELYNRATGPVGSDTANLSGWKIDKGIDFTFASGSLGPGQYLVVAADLAKFAAKYPAVNSSIVFGPWTGHLSNTSNTVELVDAGGAIVDTVTYANQGDWATREHDRGVSLVGSITRSGTTATVTLFNHGFSNGDSVQIFGATQPEYNGTFTIGGVTSTTFTYTTSGSPATPATGTIYARQLTDFTHSGWSWVSFADGLGKSLELVNPHLSNDDGQNWAASTALQGTPGAANSVLSANIAPEILDLQQLPMIPKSTEAVTVTTRIVDELGTATSATLFYRLDSTTPGAFTALAMHDNGTAGDVTAGDGVWTAVIPPQANNAIVEYYVSATDGVNARTWPAPSNLGVQGANLLYQVDDTVYAGTQPLFKLLMTANEKAELAAIGAPGSASQNSNAAMNGTFISVDPTGSEMHFTIAIRNRGGGSRDASINNFRIDINSDRPWKHRTALNLNAEFSMEDIVGSAVIRAAGLPTENVVPVQVRVNNANLASTTQFDMFGSYSWLEAEDGDFVTAHYPTDDAGNYYRGTSSAHTATLAYLGPDPASYLSNYSKQTNREANDWTDLINLTKAFDSTQTPNAAFVAAMNQNLDVTEWLRYFAASTLIGNQETALSTGFGDDYSLYRGIFDTQFQIITHDLDTILGSGDTAGNLTESIFRATTLASVSRLLEDQAFAPLYFAQLRDLISTTFASATFNALLDNTLQSYVPQSAIDSMKTFAAGRVANVLTQIPSTLTATSALALQNGYPHATTATTSLSGLADGAKTRTVLVNGVAATWTAWTASWSAPAVALNPGINRVLVQSLDANNQEVARTYIDIWRDTGTMTNVSGTLPVGTTTWTPGGGPYHVTATLTVPSDGTLVIQPGTTVFFDAGVGLTVNGTLNAEGADTQRIRFTRTPTAASAWDKILISNTQGDSEIAYADQDWAGSGAENIQVLTARLDMDHMTWLNTTTHIVDFVDSSFRLTNSVIPTVVGVEPAHFHGMPAGGYALVQGNTWGTTTGHNDIFDFTGGKRPGAIFQVLDNVFLGAGTNNVAADDILDIDGTDAHIEGNVFMNVAPSGISDTNSAISGGSDSSFGPTTTSNVVSVRNFFYNVDYGIMMKEGNTVTSINDTFVHVLTGAFNFDEPGFAASKGVGGFADGDIFYDLPIVGGAPVIVKNAGTGSFVVNRSMTPGAAPYAGIGNSNLDPHLLNTTNVTNPRTDFVLRPGPGPAVGTGPNGRDMGAAVPAGATIAGEPVSPTFSTSATLAIGGPDIYSYKYRVNGGAWSAEIATVNPGTVNASIPPIALSGLANGTYTVDVVEKNSAGFFQADAAATHSKTWTVNTALPPHVRINEILARNAAAVNHNGTFPDLIELYNDGQGTIDLSGMSISDDPAQPQRYVFPGGTTLAQGQYLVLYGDSVVETGAIHIGFALKGSGETVTLFDTAAHGGAAIDTVTFGPQLDDLSIGRRADGTWTLTTPTFGAANVARPLGDPTQLKINEWLAHGVAPFTSDFVELYNPDSLPVNMGGYYLTDQPTGWPTENQVVPLSFFAGGGFVVFTTDGKPSQGNDHANFKLSSDQGEIGLFSAAGSRIDSVIYLTQRDGVSQGRTPDGGLPFTFFSVPSPGVTNPATVVTMQTTNLIGFEATNWKYNQTDTFADQAWIASAFNDTDANWVLGQSLIYNDPSSDPGAAVAYANTLRHTLINAVNSPRITDYFRKRFTFSGNPATATALLLKTMIDDGGVIYLNGHEIQRIAMPTGTIVASTLSTRVTPWDSQLEDWGNIGTQWLLSGDNVIAVEVHQKSGSSDIGLAIQLDVTTNVSAVPSPIRITELNYHPPGGGASYTADDFEYIELKNMGSSSFNLSGMSFAAGVSFIFPSGASSILAPGADLVIVKNAAAFAARYGSGIQIAGQFTDTLDDVGEEIRLLDVNNVIVQDFVYSNTWYPSTDGQGFSLTIVNPAADPATWSSPTAWRASKFVLGSPGAEEVSLAAGAVVINELLAHSHTDLATGDWIELKNTTASPIEISGWYLTDSAANSFKFRIPAGTVIQAFGFQTFTEGADFGNPANPGALAPFGFSEDGEEAYLSASSSAGTLSGYREGVAFAASESDVPFGRYSTSTGRVDFVAMSAPTLGAANVYPKVGPIVINELMYHPASGGDEYIELRNIASHDVPLFDPANPANTWQLTDGVSFVFPTGVTIPTNGLLMVVPIDPATFRTKYSIPAAVQILGPYSGALNNAGENVALSAPLDPEPGVPLSYFVVDQVSYDDAAPWPATADGSGPSLERKFAINYSNDVANWVAGPSGGTPGATNLITTFSTVAGRDVFYNRSAFDGNNSAATSLDDGAVAGDKQALLPGQTAAFVNYTSFNKGMNGIMIDVAGLPGGANLTAEDFAFKMGNDSTPGGWGAAPSPTSVSVRAGAGAGGSDRVTIVWPDGAILNQWLQVTVKVDAKTGLANPDVFYFGNAVGETGDSAADAQVTADDEQGVISHPRSIFSPASLSDHYDFNRDRVVNATDAVIARQNQTSAATALVLFTAPNGGSVPGSPLVAAPGSASPALDAAPNSAAMSATTSGAAEAKSQLASAMSSAAAIAAPAPAELPASGIVPAADPAPTAGQPVSLTAANLANPVSPSTPLKTPPAGSLATIVNQPPPRFRFERAAVVAVWNALDDTGHQGAWWGRGHLSSAAIGQPDPSVIESLDETFGLPATSGRRLYVHL